MSRAAVFAALVLLSIAMFWAPLCALTSLAWHNPEYSHILLVVPVAGCLAYMEKRRVTANAQPAPWMALLTFIPATLAAWFGAGRGAAFSESTRLALSILGLVLFWLGSVLLIFGHRVFGQVRFSLLFLLLLVPMPEFLLSRTITLLQAGSAKTALWFFQLGGIPVSQHHFVLSLPGLDIEVAQECSGIRSSMMLLLTSLVLGHLFLRWTREMVLLMLVVIPISVLKNGLRIFVLSTLGLYVDEGWLNGNLHHRGGAVFFAFGIGLIMLIIWGLRRMETRRLAGTDLARDSRSL